MRIGHVLFYLLMCAAIGGCTHPASDLVTFESAVDEGVLEPYSPDFPDGAFVMA